MSGITVGGRSNFGTPSAASTDREICLNSLCLRVGLPLLQDRVVGKGLVSGGASLWPFSETEEQRWQAFFSDNSANAQLSESYLAIVVSSHGQFSGHALSCDH
jgi:hypothetical protein